MPATMMMLVMMATMLMTVIADADDDDTGVFPSALLAFHCFWRRCFCSLPLHLGISRLAGVLFNVQASWGEYFSLSDNSEYDGMYWWS